MRAIEKSEKWAGYALVILAAIAIGVALLRAIPQRILDSPQLPAWVQAIGSIAAIIGAAFLMKWQSDAATKLAVDMDFRAMARRLAAAEAIVEHAYKHSEVLQTHTTPIGTYYDYFFATVHPIDLDSALAALRAIPIHTLDSYNMVSAIQQLTIRLGELRPFADIHCRSQDAHYIFEEDDAFQVNYFCKKVRQARDLFRQSIVELGHSTTK